MIGWHSQETTRIANPGWPNGAPFGKLPRRFAIGHFADRICSAPQGDMMQPQAVPEAPVYRPGRRWRWRPAMLVLVLGLTVGSAGEVVNTIIGANWHEVIPGRVYRCAQLAPEELRERIARHGIR